MSGMARVEIMSARALEQVTIFDKESILFEIAKHHLHS